MRNRNNKGKNVIAIKEYHLRKRAIEANENKLKVAELQTHVESYCKHFGCGKQLKAIESLYSDYCFKHQRENK